MYDLTACYVKLYELELCLVYVKKDTSQYCNSNSRSIFLGKKVFVCNWLQTQCLIHSIVSNNGLAEIFFSIAKRQN